LIDGKWVACGRKKIPLDKLRAVKVYSDREYLGSSRQKLSPDLYFRGKYGLFLKILLCQ
jgi:hypothetical protein